MQQFTIFIQKTLDVQKTRADNEFRRSLVCYYWIGWTRVMGDDEYALMS